MSYIAQRDALLVHAKAAARAADAKWTNVAVGMPALSGSKGCRLFYGGEDDAPAMPFQAAIDGRVLKGEHVSLVAWWAISNLTTSALAAVDTEMFTFKHSLRALVIADQELGGDASGLVMDDVEADAVVFGGTRYALIGADFLVGHTTYTP